MPYVRVTSSTYADPAREQEALRFIEEELVAALRRQPGFRRYLSGIDRDARRAISISEWDERAQAEGLVEALGDARQHLLGRIEALGIQIEGTQVYEITAQV